MFIEAEYPEEKTRFKVTITFDCAKIKVSCPKINIELPKTRLVYYTTKDRTLTLVFLKKDPELSYFFGENEKEAAKAFNTDGNITIRAVEGTQPSSNSRYPRDEEDNF